MDIGLLTVEIPENEDVNFCIKYYTQLHNISDNATTAKRYPLDNLLFLNDDIDLCNEETITQPFDGKIVVASVPPVSNDTQSMVL